MKSFFKEFKEFISRGNVLDLSVAVIIGAAFGAIVTALTDKIIMPLINWVLAICGGKNGLESAYTILSASYDENGMLDLSKSIYIDWGAFIAAILNFLIIAFTLFLIIRTINHANKKLSSLKGTIEHQNSKEVRAEKKAVKAQAKEQNRPFKEVWAEHEAEKQRIADEKAQQIAEEQARIEAEERANNPTEQELLKEIKELLSLSVTQKSNK